MSMKNQLLTLVTLFLVFQLTQAQNTVNGFVVSSETNDAILFGSVALWQEEKLIKGTETNLEGFFEIEDIPDGNYRLEFSYVGYTTLSVPVELAKGRTDHNVYAIEEGLMLEEIVVIDSCVRLYRCPHSGCGNTVCSNCFETYDDERPVWREKNDSVSDVSTNILIYPNPARDYIHVRVDENIKLISIVDGVGRNKVQVQNTNSELLTLPVAGLREGNYFLNTINKDGSVKVEQFVKVD